MFIYHNILRLSIPKYTILLDLTKQSPGMRPTPHTGTLLIERGRGKPDFIGKDGSLAFWPECSCQPVARQYEQAHYRQIVQQKAYQRLGVVEEHKVAFQQQIAPHVPPDEGYRTVGRPEISQQPQSPCAGLEGCQMLPHHGQHHVPVHSQMQAHQHEAPIGAQHMQLFRP